MVKLCPENSIESPEMYARAVYSIILYAGPAWFEAVSPKEQLGHLAGATRRILLKLSGSSKTISLPAADVLTGIPPAKLLVMEKCEPDRQEPYLTASDSVGNSLK